MNKINTRTSNVVVVVVGKLDALRIVSNFFSTSNR